MKMGAARHPKLLDLARRLQVTRPTAIGYLELLWQFTAEFAPQGDVGRHGPAAIAEALDWTDEPMTLIVALVEAQWLDRGDNGQLCIHDWAYHCPDWLRKRLKRQGLQFVCAERRRTAPNGAERRNTSPSAAPTKPNQAQPSPTKPSQAQPHTPSAKNADCAPAEGDSETPPEPQPRSKYPGFVRFWQAWPKSRRKASKAKCFTKWKRDKLEAKADWIVELVEAEKQTHEWTKEGGRFIPAPLVWLTQQRWDRDSPPDAQDGQDRSAEDLARWREERKRQKERQA